MNLRDVDVWFFDCDGVLLDSNAAKTEAFRIAAAPYGDDVASRLVEFHVANGGVSRQVKLDFLFDELLGRAPERGELEGLLEVFARAATDGLRRAALDPAVPDLLADIRGAGSRTYVVTGGSELEVAQELERRRLVDLFDGVHGNPRSKHDILEALMAEVCPSHGCFVGDGSLDAKVSVDFGLSFVFVRHWSEWAGAEAVLPDGAVVVDDLGELHEEWRSAR